jgi:CSLREA domain-containing protein
MRPLLTKLFGNTFTLGFLVWIASALGLSAATLTVTKTDDTADGICNADCSLREAIAAAASGDTIVFSSLFNAPQVITLSEAEGFQTLNVTDKNLTITGKGANLTTVRRNPSAVARFRVFGFNQNFASPTMTVSGLTITGGDDPFTAGGIYNSATLTLSGVHVTGNTGTDAGGISSPRSLNLFNSTVSNNTATGSPFINNGNDNAGGIRNGGGTLNVTNSTISGNRVTGGNSSAGGILSYIATTTITNSTITDNEATGSSAGGVFRTGTSSSLSTTIRGSIIAGNRNNSTTPDVARSGVNFISQGYNLIGSAPAGIGFTNGSNNDQVGNLTAPLNPRLAPLADSGGPTQTHAVMTGSPAIDKGNSFGLGLDQRGMIRPYDNPQIANATGGDAADIGAFEESPATGLQLTAAVSRKQHGTAGTFDIPLPLINEPGVECRSSGGAHTLVFTFSNSVVSGNASVTTGVGSVSGSPTFSANTITVNLSGVADVQKITVTLSGVTDSAGTVLPNTAVSMNMLIGDINASKVVNASDIGAVKAQSGLPVTGANFRADVAVSGGITASDIGLVKSRSGASVP